MRTAKIGWFAISLLAPSSDALCSYIVASLLLVAMPGATGSFLLVRNHESTSTCQLETRRIAPYFRSAPDINAPLPAPVSASAQLLCLGSGATLSKTTLFRQFVGLFCIERDADSCQGRCLPNLQKRAFVPDIVVARACGVLLSPLPLRSILFYRAQYIKATGVCAYPQHASLSGTIFALLMCFSLQWKAAPAAQQTNICMYSSNRLVQQPFCSSDVLSVFMFPNSCPPVPAPVLSPQLLLTSSMCIRQTDSDSDLEL